MMFDPRFVPATSSCSEAIASTWPIGDSNVPALERNVVGDPLTASTPLWSQCSCVISSTWAVTSRIAG